MRKLGRGEPQGLVEQELAGGVGQVVFAPDDMGDFHQAVIDDHSEIVGATPSERRMTKSPIFRPSKDIRP